MNVLLAHSICHKLDDRYAPVSYRTCAPELSGFDHVVPLRKKRIAGRRKTDKTSRMSTATLPTEGQLVIPKRFPNALHLQPGDKVVFAIEGEKHVLQRDRPGRAKLVRGKYGRPVLSAPPGAPSMTPERVKAILEELSCATFWT